MRTILPVFLAFTCCLALRPLQAEVPRPFQVTPEKLQLSGPFDRGQLVVTALSSQGSIDEHSDDLTDQAKFTSLSDQVVRVDSSGLIYAVGNGKTTIEVEVNGKKVEVPIEVVQADTVKVDFLKDVRPVFSKSGCSAGACHAAQHGKGGFKLSVFGFDPNADYESIVLSSRGRRINPARPEASLILEKATMRVSHGGGVKLEAGSHEFEIVEEWIRSGSKRSVEKDAAVTKIDVYPKQRVDDLGSKQQLRVVARYADGSQRDITPLALYDAIDTGVVKVTPRGFVTLIGKGQTSVMVRYEGQVAVSTFVIPYGPKAELAGWKSNNYVDEIAAAKFYDLGLEPSPLCDDATFIRRAFLDAVGSLPEPEVILSFLESNDPKKRERLVDRLLGFTGEPSLDIYNDRYAAFWTLRWSDVIRNSSKALGEQGMWAMHNWIRDSFRINKPFDDFVKELVTAKGSIYSNGPANYFRVHGDSSALTEATSQLFLGVRLECAKCHQHPFESISQTDYYSMAAFFSRVGSKNSEDFGLFGRETVVMVKPTGEVSHPRTGKKLAPTPLGGEPLDHELDRRIPLAEWLTSPDNPYFARSIVNRYVGFLLGYGLVEPVDDMRSTNPPSNVAMIDALAKDLIEHDYNLKHLMRVIMTSRLYSLSSQPTVENASDRRFYSHFHVKRLQAEPLLDSIDHATGVQTKFKSLPLGTRAIELPDAEYPDYFLNTFAKPRRASVCECERTADANLAQALHTLNGDTLSIKIAAKEGRIAKMLSAKKSHEEIVRDLYLASLCRLPSEEEMEASQEFLKEAASPQECYQDLLWALINSKQFLFVR